MEVRGVHHVAMVVERLDEAVETYETWFGARVELRETLEEQGVEAAMLRLGEGRIELIAPLDDGSGVARYLAKRGPGMHHVALEVDDAGEAVRDLVARGASVVDPEPRPGLGGHLVAFVHPDSVHGVLVEVMSDGRAR